MRIKITHSFLATFTSTGSGSGSGFAFTITPNPAIESLPAGQPAIYDLDVAPSGGKFPNNVNLAFSGNCPPLSTCALSSTQVIKGSGDTHVTFTITTTAPVIAKLRRARSLRPIIYALWLSLPGLIVVFGAVGQSRRRRKRFVVSSSAYRSWTLAGSRLRRRIARQRQRRKWAGGNTVGNLHHDGKRYHEFFSATDRTGAVDS